MSRWGKVIYIYVYVRMCLKYYGTLTMVSSVPATARALLGDWPSADIVVTAEWSDNIVVDIE